MSKIMKIVVREGKDGWKLKSASDNHEARVSNNRIRTNVYATRRDAFDVASAIGRKYGNTEIRVINSEGDMIQRRTYGVNLLPTKR